MEEEYKFVVDVDDVLRELSVAMLTLYNAEFDENKKWEEVSDYSVTKSFPRVAERYGDVSKWFFQTHGHELFWGSPAIKGAVKAVNKLSDYGTVHIVTKQKTVYNKVDTLLWLEKNGIKYDSVSFVEDKSIIDCDFFIDDFHENFVGCGRKGATGILINAPYNKNVDITELKRETGFEHIMRFDSIMEFVREFEKFNIF